MHFARSAHAKSAASRTAVPRAIHSPGRGSCAATSAPRSANAAYASVRFVYCHESSGETDQIVVKPAHTASPKSAVRKVTPAASSRGAGSAPARTALATIAARRSAAPPIQTSGRVTSPAKGTMQRMRARLRQRRLRRSPAVGPELAPAVTVPLSNRRRRPVHKRFTSALLPEHRRRGDLLRNVLTRDVWRGRVWSTGD